MSHQTVEDPNFNFSDLLQWRSESAMEDWLETYLCDSHYPVLGLRDCISVFRQLRIEGANESGNGPAPADLIALIETHTYSHPPGDPDDHYHDCVWVVFELKNDLIRPKDLAQLARYMRAIRGIDPETGEPTPWPVLGVAFGTGMTHEAANLLEWIPSMIGAAPSLVDAEAIQLATWSEWEGLKPKAEGLKVVDGGAS